MEIQELKQLHERTNNQDRELFLKQLLYFRKIMCSTEYTIKQKKIHFQNLSESYFRCNLTEGDIVLFQATADEFQRRSEYELFNISQLNSEKADE